MKDFVPHKQSLELKELGFDEECLALFSRDKSLLIKQMPNQQECEQYFGGVLAPTFSQAFKWFREIHDLDIISRPHIGKTKKYICDPVNYRLEARNTPEEAELKCLIKLIEIVKEDKPTIANTVKKFHSKESTEQAIRELVEHHITQFSKVFNLNADWRDSLTKKYIEKYL